MKCYCIKIKYLHAQYSKTLTVHVQSKDVVNIMFSTYVQSKDVCASCLPFGTYEMYGAMGVHL
jgi:hypothetical protein